MALLTVAAVAAAWSANVAAQDPLTYEDMTVGFIQTGSESGWRAANTASFKETAEQLGIDLKFYDAQNKLENQVSAFHQFNQDPAVDVIILAALDVTGYDEVLQEAKDNGKIVVLEDRRIDADPSDSTPPTSAPTSTSRARRPPTAMCDLLEDSDKKNVVEIAGAVGASAAIDRAAGLPRGHGRVRHRDHRQPDRQLGRRPSRKAVMEAFLKNHEDIAGRLRPQRRGSHRCRPGASRRPASVPGKDIKVIGVDATADGFEYLIPGKINALIECNPLLAPQVYEAALAALNGETAAQVGSLPGRRVLRRPGCRRAATRSSRPASTRPPARRPVAAAPRRSAPRAAPPCTRTLSSTPRGPSTVSDQDAAALHAGHRQGLPGRPGPRRRGLRPRRGRDPRRRRRERRRQVDPDQGPRPASSAPTPATITSTGRDVRGPLARSTPSRWASAPSTRRSTSAPTSRSPRTCSSAGRPCAGASPSTGTR